jgi:uncharacterized protein (TIRG00374 family)
VNGKAASATGPRIPLRWLVRIGATVLVLALLAWWLPFDQLLSAMGAVPVATWPMAVGVYLAAHLLGVAKWRRLVNAAGAGLPTRQAVHAYYWGLFGNLFLPSLVGGDVVRAGVAMRHARSRGAIVLGSLVDRAQDVIGLGLLAGIGAVLAPRALDQTSRQIFLVFLAVMITGGAGGLLLLRFFPARLVPWRVRRLLVRVRQALRATASRPAALVTAFGLGLALQSTLILVNWELGRLIGIDIALHVWFFVWPLAKIASLLPVTQGGIGVREAAQAALFAPFGVGAVQAVATGLVFEVVIVTGGLLSGGIAVLLRGTADRRRGTASAGSMAGPA